MTYHKTLPYSTIVETGDDGITYDILYDILIKQNGEIHSDWTGVKLDVEVPPRDLRAIRPAGSGRHHRLLMQTSPSVLTVQRGMFPSLPKNQSLFKISVAMYDRELCVTISFASFLPLYLAKRTYPPRNTSIVTSCALLVVRKRTKTSPPSRW